MRTVLARACVNGAAALLACSVWLDDEVFGEMFEHAVDSTLGELKRMRRIKATRKRAVAAETEGGLK